MEITLEKQDAVNGKIKINLAETDYLPQYQLKLKEFSKKASIKGFRPGKVPAGLINKMYGKGIMVDEVNKVVSNSLQKYIEENKLQIVGNPIPDQIVDNPEDFFDRKDHEFAFKVGLVPEFTLAVPPAKAITKYVIEITDERIKEAIEEVKSANATSENSDVVNSAEDMVFGDLKEINGDYSTFGLIPLNKVFDSELKKFIGKKIDEEVIFDVKVAFSNDDSLVSYATGVPKEKVESLTSDFSLKITRVSRQTPATLSQELFDKVYGAGVVNSEEEFINKLKETIAENYDRETDAKYRIDVRQYLLDNTKLDLPLDFLKEWLLYTSTKEEEKADVVNNFDAYAIDLRWTLIRDTIIENHKPEVKYEDVKARTVELFKAQYGLPVSNTSMDESLSNIADNFLSAEKGKNFTNLYRQVQFDRAFGSYLQTLVPAEKTISLEKFKELSNK